MASMALRERVVYMKRFNRTSVAPSTLMSIYKNNSISFKKVDLCSTYKFRNQQKILAEQQRYVAMLKAIP